MHSYLRYGRTIEITETEKEPREVRVRVARQRKLIHGARRPDSIRRTRKICMWRLSAAIAEMGSPLLVTLTFAGQASDAAYASDKLRRFQLRMRSRFPTSKSLFVPELSPRGRIHFHGLLFGVPMHYGDTRSGRRTVTVGTERRTREFAALWGAGFVDVRQTDGSPRLASYLSKYVTKSSEQVLFNGMRMIRLSHDFPREERISGQLATQLSVKYGELVPTFQWVGNSQFVGRIVKKWYNI